MIFILFNSLFVDHSQHGVHEQGDVSQGSRNLCVPFCVWYSWVASLPAGITFTILHILNVERPACLVVCVLIDYRQKLSSQLICLRCEVGAIEINHLKGENRSSNSITFSIICDHKFFLFDIGYSIKSKWNGVKANLLLPHKRIEKFDHCCKGVL